MSNTSSLHHTDKSKHQFSEVALNNLLQLLKKEVSDHSRHLNQYFQVFLNYANKGPHEVQQITRRGRGDRMGTSRRGGDVEKEKEERQNPIKHGHQDCSQLQYVVLSVLGGLCVQT